MEMIQCDDNTPGGPAMKWMDRKSIHWPQMQSGTLCNNYGIKLQCSNNTERASEPLQTLSSSLSHSELNHFKHLHNREHFSHRRSTKILPSVAHEQYGHRKRLPPSINCICGDMYARHRRHLIGPKSPRLTRGGACWDIKQLSAIKRSG